MAGVDKNDQFLAYHRKLFATGRHSSTAFYHLADTAVDNAFIIYVLVHRKRCRTVFENYFRDSLTIKEYRKLGSIVTP